MTYYINVFTIGKNGFTLFADATYYLDEAIDYVSGKHKATDKYIHTIKIVDDKAEIIDLRGVSHD